jgi:murein L,D-transpeptidase YcbB/YkuD
MVRPLQLSVLAASLALSAGPAVSAGPAAPAAAQTSARTSAQDSAQDSAQTGLDETLRRTLDAGRAEGRLELGSAVAYASEALPRFYEARGFEPAWTDADGVLPRAAEMVAVLRRADLEGLSPGDYHLAVIEALLARLGPRSGPDSGSAGSAAAGVPTPELARLDLFLSDAALLYAGHLASGKTDPTTLHTQWRADRRDLDAAAFLEQALGSGDLAPAYDGLLPAYPGYRRLLRALAELREVARRGGWGTIAAGEALRPGETSERVPALRRRLELSGDLTREAVQEAVGSPAGTSQASGDTLYDPDLEVAVRRFQARHGLTADGVVGERTQAALDVPVERRIEQVLVNLERWRWLPRDLGERHVRVNIAGFELQAMDGGEVALSSRVIVGKRYTKTPVFSGRMTYLVLNPYWYVPGSIARNEILRDVQKDPGYLAREQLDVLAGTGPDARVLDPGTIDWASLGPRDLPYVFRQRPGTVNSLGRLKLMFPNPYNVYLHDTPARSLFEREVRAFSHGCIRVERPLALAAWVLQGDPRWTEETLQAAIDTGAQQTIVLPHPVPVHVLYWTAWVDERGVLQLRDDVYGRDPAVLRALLEAPPRTAS